MLHKLTGRTVQGAKPQTKPYEIRDTDLKGLLLRVQPSGHKAYVVEFKRGERRTIGDANVLTLEQARVTARQWLADRDSEKLPAAARGKARPLTLREFIEKRYQPWAEGEHKAAAATLANLRAQFGHLFGKKLAAITAWDLDKFKAERRKAGIAPATVNRDLDRIRSVLSKAVEWGALAEHPAKGVKRVRQDDAVRVRYLSPDEAVRLRAALDRREARRRTDRAAGNAWLAARSHDPRPIWERDEFTDHLAPLVLLALNTGLRRGELFGLMWTDVDIRGRLVTLRGSTTKSQRSRRVPLNAEATDVLTRWKGKNARVGLVFPGPKGRTMTNINKSWSALMADAQIPDFRFHDCRHDFASRLVMAGVDLYTTKELLGHSDFTMTQRYAHLAPEHTAAAVAQLDLPRIHRR